MIAVKRLIIIVCLDIAGICYGQQPALDKANDFVFIQAEGREGSLYALEAEMLLLYFYDPTCEDCHELTAQMNASSTVNQLLDENHLVILAVYPEEDMEVWIPYTSKIPAGWINGYDKGSTIHTDGLYFLTSLPALYLLDKEKNILLHTKLFNEIEKVLEKQLLTKHHSDIGRKS